MNSVRRSASLALRGLLVVAGATLVVAMGSFACSTSSSSSSASGECNAQPWQCGVGQTCWPTSCACPTSAACDGTTCIPHFACLPAPVGPNALDHCKNTLNVPTCGVQQACVEVTASTGICLDYCGANQACGLNETCTGYGVGQAPGAPKVDVCVPNVADGGADMDGAGDADSGRSLLDSSAEVGRQQ